MSSGSIVVDCLSVTSLLDVGAEMKLEIQNPESVRMFRPNLVGLSRFVLVMI